MALTLLAFRVQGELLRAFRVPNTDKTRFLRVWAKMIAWAMDFLQISMDLIVL